ncbi:hypothetical protein [Streptomyces sp. Ac-502]|uniref:hypothetical protein n=1 Tax=Streptomyces sp. Ac-502 TaxID=3342801 RepID=UPI0038628A8B
MKASLNIALNRVMAIQRTARLPVDDCPEFTPRGGVTCTLPVLMVFASVAHSLFGAVSIEGY